MEKKAPKDKTRQAPTAMRREIARLLLPMMAGIAATKKGVLDLVHHVGLPVLEDAFRVDAEQLVGVKGSGRMSRSCVQSRSAV